MHRPTKGEVVAAGHSDAAATLARWKASPLHRPILLKSGGTVTRTMAI